jgi:hypothetical protein
VHTKTRQRSQRKEGCTFSVSFNGDARQATQVNRRAFEKLRPHKANCAGATKRRGLKQATIQAVKRIVASEVALATPLGELFICAFKIEC